MTAFTSRACGLVSLATTIGCGGGDRPDAYDEARSSVVYGQDDREDPRAYPIGSPPATWARSSAMLVGLASLRKDRGEGFTLVSAGTFAESMESSGKPLCRDEPFRQQPSFVGVCSAFLVAPDVVATAGHCMYPDWVCPLVAFVFGVGYDRPGAVPGEVSADDVHFCAEVIERAYDGEGADHALVRLDRPVAGRAPLPLRRAGKVADDEDLILIGHPLGLPVKIAARGSVLDNAPAAFFKASTDSYGGESGAAVLGARSGLVEGVLARGEEDLVRRGDCWVSRVCPEDGSRCRGEDVTRATELARALDREEGNPSAR